MLNQPRTLCGYEQINRPFEEVARILRGQSSDLFRRATTSAMDRIVMRAPSLRVEMAGFKIAVETRVLVRRIRDAPALSDGVPSLSVELTWESLRAPRLFPHMLAELAATPLSATWTQLVLRGAYWTPMGRLGAAIDAAMGHRLAETAANQFLEDVTAQLRRELGDPTVGLGVGAGDSSLVQGAP